MDHLLVLRGWNPAAENSSRAQAGAVLSCSFKWSLLALDLQHQGLMPRTGPVRHPQGAQDLPEVPIYSPANDPIKPEN